MESLKKFCAHRETRRSNLNLEYPQEQTKELDQQEDEEAGYGAAGVVEGQWTGLGAVGGVEGRGGARLQWAWLRDFASVHSSLIYEKIFCFIAIIRVFTYLHCLPNPVI